MQSELSSLQDQAKFLLESCQLEKALELYEHLYSVASKNNLLTCDLLDDYAELLSSLGNIDHAKIIYNQSIQLFPLAGASKYFSLAQLSYGEESVALYIKGIALASESEKTQIASAYSALAEIYMTDLCDAPQAEQMCEEFIKNAIKADELCMDAYLALSNLRLVRNNIIEAKSALNKLKIVLENCGTENLPACDFLIQASKNFIECEDFEGLEFVTEIGLSVDENNHELMYLHAFALVKLGNKDEAKECINQLLTFEISQELREAAEEIISSLE